MKQFGMIRQWVVLLALAFFLGAGVLSGCKGSKETYNEEDDFFVPIDSAQQRPSQKFNNAIQPGAVEIQEGAASQTINEFGAPLNESEILIREKLSQNALQDSLNLISGQVAYLQNILEASTIDPRMYYHSQVKSWTINNPALRDTLFYALLAIDSSIQSEAGTDAQILATETNDLVEARFGTSVFKGLTLRQALERSTDKFLTQKLIQSSGYSKDVELRDTNFAIPTPMEPEILPTEMMVDRFIGPPPTTRGRVSVSLYEAGVVFNKNWGASFRLGNDWMGFPFWTSGNMTFLGQYKMLKIGMQLPTGMGKSGGDKFPLFALRNRLLTGTRGLTAEADFGMAGGYMMTSRLIASDVSTVPDSTSFHYITTAFVGYYSFGFSLNKTNFMRLKVGGGFHQVSNGMVTPPTSTGTFVETGTSNFSSLFMDIQYLHDISTEKFGVGLQYYNMSLLCNAWLDVIPNTLRLDMKYVRVVSRNVYPWENQDFIIVSPKFTFTF